MISATYLQQRAEECSRLAHAETDAELRSMLCDLELDYRAKALNAAARDWRDAPRYFERVTA